MVRNAKCIPIKCKAVRRYVHTQTHTRARVFSNCIFTKFAIVYVPAVKTLRVQIHNFVYFVSSILLEKLDTENGSAEQDAKCNLVKRVINESLVCLYFAIYIDLLNFEIHVY